MAESSVREEAGEAGSPVHDFVEQGLSVIDEVGIFRGDQALQPAMRLPSLRHCHHHNARLRLHPLHRKAVSLPANRSMEHVRALQCTLQTSQTSLALFTHLPHGSHSMGANVAPSEVPLSAALSTESPAQHRKGLITKLFYPHRKRLQTS